MINYRSFIQRYFSIKNKRGEVVPFHFNRAQNIYYEHLMGKYPKLVGIRENILKARQMGFSSLIDAFLTTDFIFSAMGKAPIISSQIISHKAEEVKPLFNRVNIFLDSYLKRAGITRKELLQSDNHTSYLQAKKGAELFVGTAGAKTLGRGGTLQNIHWSECAFYPNTPILNSEDLMIGAEQQVADNVGMIFRESTGNMSGDFFNLEYERGIENLGNFGSFFLPWHEFDDYQRRMPRGYDLKECATLKAIGYDAEVIMKQYNINENQLYWWIKKLETANDVKKTLREYPLSDKDAFLAGGDLFFSDASLRSYLIGVQKPIELEFSYV